MVADWADHDRTLVCADWTNVLGRLILVGAIVDHSVDDVDDDGNDLQDPTIYDYDGVDFVIVRAESVTSVRIPVAVKCYSVANGDGT